MSSELKPKSRKMIKRFTRRYSGNTLKLYKLHIRLFTTWCLDQDLQPHKAKRKHLEQYLRYLRDVKKHQTGTIHTDMVPIRGMYKLALADGLIEKNPCELLVIPHHYRDISRFAGLDRIEFGNFVKAAREVSPRHYALVHLLGFLGLRATEASNVRIEDYQESHRGYRVMAVVGKNKKAAKIPLTVPVLRALEEARENRTSGFLILSRSGKPIDRGGVAAMVRTINRHANLNRKVSPHDLRRSFVSNSLAAGVSLRDAQLGARHESPRTTALYDVARRSFDQHMVHALTGYLAREAYED